jgi:hypothetical protein
MVITSLTLYVLLGGVVYLVVGCVLVGFISWMDGIVPTDTGSILFLAALWPLALAYVAGAGLAAAFFMSMRGIVGGVMRTLTNLEARGRGGKES